MIKFLSTAKICLIVNGKYCDYFKSTYMLFCYLKLIFYNWFGIYCATNKIFKTNMQYIYIESFVECISGVLVCISYLIFVLVIHEEIGLFNYYD